MGGNVFANKTADIKKEYITPTLNAYFEELKSIFPKKSYIFNLGSFVLLGSAGKKPISGDIDLGIDISEIIDDYDSSISDWGLESDNIYKEFALLTKRARTATPEHLRRKAFLKEVTLHINKHAPTLYCDEKKVSGGNIFSLYPQLDQQGAHVGQGVQIDWMIGNLDWLKFSYYSSAYPNGSNVKGLHRTQLILSAFQVAGLSFNHVDGIKDKITGAVLSDNPRTALLILGDRLDVNVSRNDTNDYYKLHSLFKNNIKSNDYQQMIDIYFKILDSTRADIPDDMQDQWCNAKDRLGLTGKFLPDDSKLKVYT
jgi:hypothetical protein